MVTTLGMINKYVNIIYYIYIYNTFVSLLFITDFLIEN